MSEEKKEDFLHRWSRRKHEEKQLPAAKEEEKPLPTLPPVDKLTPESDFTGFMHPKVDDALRRVALKKLFSGDPHFNLPDPYEAYSGDWTVGEPIPPEMMATLNQAQQWLFSDKKKEEEGAPEAASAEAAQEAPQEASKEVAVEEKPKADEPGKQDA
jgi:hypothetical protein